MKKNIGVKNWMFPMPVLMIGTYNEDGTPNMMNAAWGGITLDDEENCNVVGKIVNCAVEESAMTDGKPDAAKMKPICFGTCAHVYRVMGDEVAKAFSCGKALM